MVTSEQKTAKFQGLQKLDQAEIQKHAPQVYTSAPFTSTSARYAFIPTYQIIEDMKTLGWEVCQAVAMKSKDPVQKAYGKHMVKFFNPEIYISDGNGGVEAYPQILIINNHRGWGRFRFEIGVFRLVCSNGLVVKDKDMGSFELRHMGYSFEELKELVNKAVVELPGVVQKINILSEKTMTEKEQREFARKALALRVGEERLIEDAVVLEILTSERKEDEGNTVWKVFNRVQEHVLRGGFEMTNEKGAARKIRAISSMLKDVELNQKLWELTEAYVE